MPKIYAPNKAFSGVSVGVQFTKGEGSTDDRRALDYFRKAGYGIGEEPFQSVPEATSIYPQSEHPVRLGTPLRDAAVEPREGDFLPPTNAGYADPHGPLVVAPGLHAVPPAPIRPGPVAVDDPARQSAEETELAQRVLVDRELATVVVQDIAASQAAELGTVAGDRPAKSANKAAWVDYAVAQGLDRDEAEDLTIGSLQERYPE